MPGAHKRIFKSKLILQIREITDIMTDLIDFGFFNRNTRQTVQDTGHPAFVRSNVRAIIQGS